MSHNQVSVSLCIIIHQQVSINTINSRYIAAHYNRILHLSTATTTVKVRSDSELTEDTPYIRAIYVVSFVSSLEKMTAIYQKCVVFTQDTLRPVNYGAKANEIICYTNSCPVAESRCKNTLRFLCSLSKRSHMKDYLHRIFLTHLVCTNIIIEPHSLGSSATFCAFQRHSIKPKSELNVATSGDPFRCYMMTSSNGNIFRVTGHLCGEFTGPRWIPHTKASDAELWCFLWSASE